MNFLKPKSLISYIYEPKTLRTMETTRQISQTEHQFFKLRTLIRGIIALAVFGLLTGNFANAVATSGFKEDGNGKKVILEVKKAIPEAMDNRDAQKLVTLKYRLNQVEKENLKPYVNYYKAYINYRLSTVQADISEDQKTKYLDEGIKFLEQAVEQKKNFAEAYAMMGNFYGMKIDGALSGMRYGPKSGELYEKAQQYDPQNPRIHMLLGIGKYYTPSMFGGGAEKAMAYFQDALKYFDTYKSANELMPDWGHAEIYAWIGQVHARQDQYEAAVASYKKALKVHPDYGWVKNVLLPQTQKKLNSSG